MSQMEDIKKERGMSKKIKFYNTPRYLYKTLIEKM